MGKLPEWMDSRAVSLKERGTAKRPPCSPHGWSLQGRDERTLITRRNMGVTFDRGTSERFREGLAIRCKNMLDVYIHDNWIASNSDKNSLTASG